MKKKIVLAIFLIFGALFSFTSCNVINRISGQFGNDAIEHEGMEFTLSEDGSYYILSSVGTCEDADIVIPSEYEGLPVKQIGDKAFCNSTTIKSIVIPDSVTMIGETFDDENEVLSNIIVGDGTIIMGPVIIMGNNISGPFAHCTNLKSVTLGKNVESIGKYAFYGCTKLISITVPEKVTHISNYAFDGCYGLIEVINRSMLDIRKRNEYDQNYRYSPFGGITDNALDLHKGESKIDYIDGYAFYNYEGENLLVGYTGDEKDLILPENYKGETYIIRDYAFYYSEFGDVIISDGVTAIGDAFCGSSVKSLVLGNGIKELNIDMIYHCSPMSITIGKNVEKIYTDEGHEIDYESSLTNLVEIVNRSSLDIKAGSKDHCGIAYNALDVHGGESKMADYGDYIFYSGGDKNYMLGYVGKEESIVLPESYEGKSYEIYRFIPTYSSPLSITVSSGVTHIADGAFEYRSLIEVINKSSLDIRIGSEEHGGIALYALEVHSGESRIVEYGDYLFYDAADNNYLLGYMGKEENIVLPDGFNGERYEVYSASGVNVVSVTIPACVTKLREYALSSLTLRTVIIEKGVTYIDSDVYYWFNSISDIYYTGTEDEWKAIVENGELNSGYSNCQFHFNYVP